MTDLLLKGANLLGDKGADVLVREGVIAEIGSIPAAGELDGRRLTVVDAARLGRCGRGWFHCDPCDGQHLSGDRHG